MGGEGGSAARFRACTGRSLLPRRGAVGVEGVQLALRILTGAGTLDAAVGTEVADSRVAEEGAEMGDPDQVGWKLAVAGHPVGEEGPVAHR